MNTLTNIRNLLDESQHDNNSNLFHSRTNKKNFYKEKINQQYINGTYSIYENNTPTEEYFQSVNNVGLGGKCYWLDSNDQFNLMEIDFQITTKDLNEDTIQTNRVSTNQLTNLTLLTPKADKSGLKEIPITNKTVQNPLTINNNGVINICFNRTNINHNALILHIPSDVSDNIRYNGVWQEYATVNQKITLNGSPTITSNNISVSVDATTPSTFIMNQVIDLRSNYNNQVTQTNNVFQKTTYRIPNDNTSNVQLSVSSTSSAKRYTVILNLMKTVVDGVETIYLGDMISNPIP